MAEQPETRLQKKMVKRIENLPCPSRARKMHGSAFTRAGEPDIDAVICGIPLKIEVKMPGNTPTKLQTQRILEWAAAGAVAGWCDTMEGMDEFIIEALVVASNSGWAAARHILDTGL